VLIASIVARNYLPQARVLARSFRAHHPTGRVLVLVLDPVTPGAGIPVPFPVTAAAGAGPAPGLRPDEPFEVVTPSELGIEPAELRRMSTIYDVLELATALKPFLLRHLVVDRGEPTATYLDPDIEVFAPLDDLHDLALAHGVVLTPHRLVPLDEDGREPADTVFALSGAYNLGYVTVSAAALPFLDWWAERCRRDCIHSVGEGLFVDQRWVDLAVTYFDHHVVRDPGCNVAYWNLDRRPLTEATGGGGDGPCLAGGVPLRFFHYSAYDPDVPHLLSRYQGERPRVLLSEQPALRRLCQRYGERLEAEGWSSHRSLGYGLDRAANGLRLDRTMRRLFRQELLERERGTADDVGKVDELPDPFDPDQADGFVALLRSPYPGSEAPRIPRYLYALYLTRPDLQQFFPDLTGEGGNHFLWWAREKGERELGLPAELLPSQDDLYPDYDPYPKPTAPGVRLVGYFAAELGVGEAGRSMAAALRAAGEPFWPISERQTWNRQRDPELADASEAAPDDGDLNLVCVNADRLPTVLDRLGPQFGWHRYRIGMWAWEVERFPDVYVPAADLVDEVWTYSRHAAEALRAAIAKPVHTVPLPVVERPPAPRSRSELGLPDGFVFLFCFDFFSVAERKNPLGVIEAFRRAFPVPAAPGSDGPHLVIKSINGSAKLSELERLRMRVLDRPDVHIRDGYLDPADQRALIAACDAYVSLHRAEGFGYTMAEAMLRAKPVIATGYSGNLEFMDEDNSFLVGHTLVPIGEGAQPYPAGARWADPDLGQAASLMQRVVADTDGARAVGERARDDIRRRHSPAARGPLVAARLAAARAAAADARHQRTRPGFLSRNPTAQSVLVRTNRLIGRFLPPELR
jgi:glycosyltransferase involved in cell wall biosynthesis